MSGPTCPACHVPVMPGYTKCPKCHKALPYKARGRAGTIDPGGTVATQKQSPVVPIAIAIGVATAIILFFGLRNRGDSTPETPPAVVDQPAVRPPVAQAPQPPPPPPDQPLAPAAPRRPSATATATELEKALRKQRLWSTVEVVGDHADVRSGSCSDAAIGPVLDASRAALRDAGLTRLRCLEQSGHLVFEREL